MGDYYFAGVGGEGETAGQPQWEKAAACYQSAATTRISAMAMWNLGWMHENGKGVAKVGFVSILPLGVAFLTRLAVSTLSSAADLPQPLIFLDNSVRVI
jgi:TPR repeat protein